VKRRIKKTRRVLPDVIDIKGAPHRCVEVLKEDFYAITRIYEGPAGKFIVKAAQLYPFRNFVREWIARFLVAREIKIHKRLRRVEGVPRVVGTVGRYGFIRRYVPGETLNRAPKIPDDYFDRLKIILEKVHAAGVAHIDIEKPENILVASDGSPYIIDFQISWCPYLWIAPFRWLTYPLFRIATREDWYHFYKHKRKRRRDLVSDEEYRRGKNASVVIRLHRFLFAPYFFFRRRIKRRLGMGRGEDRPSK
jgi:serine/threonine protein kinase